MAKLTPNSPVEMHRLVALALAVNPSLIESRFTRLLERSSVYEWREPTRHPVGFFVAHPDVYAWFDPINGVAVQARTNWRGVDYAELWSDELPENVIWGADYGRS